VPIRHVPTGWYTVLAVRRTYSLIAAGSLTAGPGASSSPIHRETAGCAMMRPASATPATRTAPS
jgi:hypothetical protein